LKTHSINDHLISCWYLIVIRNLFIILAGTALVKQCFGKCQSFTGGDTLVAGFMEALSSFSEEIAGSSIKSIDFEDFKFFLFRDPEMNNLLFVLVSDLDDDPQVLSNKIKRIACLFKEAHLKDVKNFHGKLNLFDDFANRLVETDLTELTCGKHENCEECPYRDKNSEILEMLKEDDKEFLSQLKTKIEEDKKIQIKTKA